MIDRSAIALTFQDPLPAQQNSTVTQSRIINLPGVISRPEVRSGIPVIEFDRSNAIIKRVAFGVFVVALIGDAALDLVIQMQTPVGTFINLEELDTISTTGETNILFDPLAPIGGGPPNGFDSTENKPISYPSLRITCSVAGTGNAAAFYVAWLEMS